MVQIGAPKANNKTNKKPHYWQISVSPDHAQSMNAIPCRHHAVPGFAGIGG